MPLQRILPEVGRRVNLLVLEQVYLVMFFEDVGFVLSLQLLLLLFPIVLLPCFLLLLSPGFLLLYLFRLLL